MSSTTGLQRRRATGRVGSLDPEEDPGAIVGGKTQGIRPAEPKSHETSSGSGSRSTIEKETGHRVAYDPRDLEESDESTGLPRLTLMEELYLLGLKDRQGYLSFWNEHMSYVLRGSIVMELALRGRLRVAKTQDNRHAEPADRVLEVCSTKHTGDPLLDEAVRVIKSNAPASIAEWIDLLNG
ncbi:Vacuolar protein sorting-associated protein 74 [Malassezia psittaci]|uniref:Vacuolar protein sorting-associated protein 74 n=1 Tax=Malassezia psittaci TaxID=1821823 RepID=A0AAF0FDT5_9BASI|nr:Vacuolar protein sorting-associated protein 74 [Malassezia psittaci]